MTSTTLHLADTLPAHLRQVFFEAVESRIHCGALESVAADQAWRQVHEMMEPGADVAAGVNHE
jgi:hypothetical protein